MKTAGNATRVAMLEAEVERLKGVLQKKADRGEMSLTQAREFIKLHRADGLKCFCCGQKIVGLLEERTLSSIISHLLTLADIPGDREGWFKIKDLFSGGDYAKLRFWGFIEDSNGGIWRVTEAGRAFLRGETKVHNTAFFVKDDLDHLEGRMVSIRDFPFAKAKPIRAARPKSQRKMGQVLALATKTANRA